jgi:hypothetical protein
MKLSTTLARNFTKNVRNRGAEYYSERRVQIQRGTDFEVEALVLGSEKYGVQLKWRDDVLALWCDCPYFVENAIPCKHIWAAVLAAEQQGYLSVVASAEDVAVDTEDPELLADDGGELAMDTAPPHVSSTYRLFAPQPAPPRRPAWERQLNEILSPPLRLSEAGERWPAKREILYIVDVSSSKQRFGLVLSLQARDRKNDGSLGQLKPLGMKCSQIAQLSLAEDREILSALSGGEEFGYGNYDSYSRVVEWPLLSPILSNMLMPRIARTGRCYLRLQNEQELLPLAWDEGGPWNFGLQMRQASRGYAIGGAFRRGEERMDVTAPVFVTPNLLFTRERVAPIVEGLAFDWINALREKGPIKVSGKERDQFLAALLCSPNLPALEVPEELQYEEVVIPPQPRVKIFKPQLQFGSDRLRAELSFDYQDRSFAERDPAGGWFEASSRRFVRRDVARERGATELLDQLGVKRRGSSYWNQKSERELAASKLPRVVRSIVEAGWHVEAEGKIFRRPGAIRMEVSSGVDWFELHGTVEYGGAVVKLPQLLEAVRRNEKLVRLDDGTYGLMPEEWLLRVGALVAMGEPENNHLQFRRSQAGLLDALLATQPEACCDEIFARVREELRQFQGIAPAQQPAGFVGQLRNYQNEGLGWMGFLQRLSFGGCLADDMGVGKTAQVLALLETRRELRATGQVSNPSLVVVPKSLVFNWKDEAARFTPQLRVLDHTGMAREAHDLTDCDVVLTTYGTLRRDVLRLKQIPFDYVVLDEAQAVKNADTESSKAVRLLQGRHRLALSGTPVENHLGELWTLFEFLNPGMLGAASAFKSVGGKMRNPDEGTRQVLAQALRPFILRRTKEQVAPELPPKSEQTVYCEMESKQREVYEELRQHYRASLLKRIEVEGLAKSKIQVLEALLRLRQAACHPGLLDSKRKNDPSAKLDVLMEQLREVLDEGHKALVFSQFTSLLAIVRNRLDQLKISYEYLDGATHDRQACVERFQQDDTCRLFLISLKAGGLGLNLTAAEYIFILDPWWNPAVEAQAVDRAHRIGQTKPVFAYRLITKDTVEEKVLELQKSKRDLAAAIIGAENSMIRNLQPEDLALLLS